MRLDFELSMGFSKPTSPAHPSSCEFCTTQTYLPSADPAHGHEPTKLHPLPSLRPGLPPSLPPSKVPASRHHEKGSERGRGRPTKASLAMPPAAPFVARRSAGQAGIYAPSCSGRRRRRRHVRTWIGRPTAGAGGGRVLPLKQRGGLAGGRRVDAALSVSLALFVSRLRVGLVDDDGGDAMRGAGNAAGVKDNKCNADNRQTEGRKEGEKEGEKTKWEGVK